MKKLLAIAVLLAGAMSAHARIGETKEQIIRRFGAASMTERNDQAGFMTFVGQNYVAVRFNGYDRSACEIYLLNSPYSVRDANEIAQTVLGGAPVKQWRALTDWRKVSDDATYEVNVFSSFGGYRWGIAVGHTYMVEVFRDFAARAQSQPTPQPRPTVLPNYYSPTPQRNRVTPNDCTIVAAEAYARLKPVTYWCQIMGVHIETATEVFGHAMVFYKVEADGFTFVYDARGASMLNTGSMKPEELAEAVKPNLYRGLTSGYPTKVTLVPLTSDEVRRYKPTATYKTPATSATPDAATVEMIFAVMFIVMIKLIIGGGVGYMIGKSKNRAKEGFWLGFLIGLIGWLITASMSKKLHHAVT
jgi:hypothetical protein